jgi:hypothetical protein
MSSFSDRTPFVTERTIFEARTESSLLASPHHGVSANRSKRPALAELSPFTTKRTNVIVTEANGGIQVPVTPNEDKNSSKFPGLYHRSYLC